MTLPYWITGPAIVVIIAVLIAVLWFIPKDVIISFKDFSIQILTVKKGKEVALPAPPKEPEVALPKEPRPRFVTKTVTFAVAFGSTPKIAIAVDPMKVKRWWIEQVTTTGFTAWFEPQPGFTGEEVPFEWTAIGE